MKIKSGVSGESRGNKIKINVKKNKIINMTLEKMTDMENVTEEVASTTEKKKTKREKYSKIKEENFVKTKT